MHFTKMHGLGNDYLYVYGTVPANIKELSQKLSNRHFGIGADGMIYICPSTIADFQMRIFNADGSEAKMCGNGIRCVGKYVYEKGYTNKTHLQIETLSGIKHLDLHVLDGHVKNVTVNMGIVTVGDPIVLDVDSTPITIIPVSVGNPHAVIIVDDICSIPLGVLGAKIEQHPAFPDGVNVEFVQLLNKNELRMRVWERGSGITMACGTGACAAAAVVKKNFHPSNNVPITVILDGGKLSIQVHEDQTVTMSGEAETICEGDVVSC